MTLPTEAQWEYGGRGFPIDLVTVAKAKNKKEKIGVEELLDLLRQKRGLYENFVEKLEFGAKIFEEEPTREDLERILKAEEPHLYAWHGSGTRSVVFPEEWRYCPEGMVKADWGLANGFRLYRMGGNVWEWVDDWFDGDSKVRKGGSWWLSGPHNPRVAGRDRSLPESLPDYGYTYIGFRLAFPF